MEGGGIETLTDFLCFHQSRQKQQELGLFPVSRLLNYTSERAVIFTLKLEADSEAAGASRWGG